MRVGVTGHVDVRAVSPAWVTEALRAYLVAVAGPGVHGVTCLARGTDQLFARVVLALGGRFDVVLPAKDYAEVVAGCGNDGDFRQLLDRADSVVTMPYARSTRAAFLAASEAMLERSDRLVAVWDGLPSRRVGDTADVVRAAAEREVPSAVLWPGRDFPGRDDLATPRPSEVNAVAAPDPG